MLPLVDRGPRDAGRDRVKWGAFGRVSCSLYLGNERILLLEYKIQKLLRTRMVRGGLHLLAGVRGTWEGAAYGEARLGEFLAWFTLLKLKELLKWLIAKKYEIALYDLKRNTDIIRPRTLAMVYVLVMTLWRLCSLWLYGVIFFFCIFYQPFPAVNVSMFSSVNLLQCYFETYLLGLNLLVQAIEILLHVHKNTFSNSRIIKIVVIF